MRHTVRIVDEARLQMEEIAGWDAKESGSIELGQRWFHGLLDAIDGLGERPLSGSLSPENDRLGLELRELHYGSGRKKTHRAVYRILGSVVEVLAIRHRAQRELRRSDLPDIEL